MARRGGEIELPSREIVIHGLEIIDFEPERVRMRIACGSGTYIRSLGSDIARGLGTDAVMCRLVRTAIGSIRLQDCCDLRRLTDRAEVVRSIHDPARLLTQMPRILLSAQGCRQISHGIPITESDIVSQDAPIPVGEQLAESSAGESKPIAAFDELGRLAAILTRRSDGRYRSLRVFQKTSDTHQPQPNSRPQSPES